MFVRDRSSREKKHILPRREVYTRGFPLDFLYRVINQMKNKGEHNVNTNLEDVRATAEVAISDDRTGVQAPLGDDIVVRLTL